MKCKSWSNKINNFVVRRLKSIKVNIRYKYRRNIEIYETSVSKYRKEILNYLVSFDTDHLKSLDIYEIKEIY